MKVYRKIAAIAVSILFLFPLQQLQAKVAGLEWKDGKITAHFRDVPLRAGLAELAQETGVTFLVDPDVDGRLNMRMDKAPLVLGIRRLLSNYNHVVVQSRDRDGRAVPKLVRILRKGASTAPRFDVIHQTGSKFVQVPAGGFKNYRAMVERRRPTGKASHPPSMGPAQHYRKLTQLRSKAAQLRRSIEAKKKRQSILRSNLSRNRNAEDGLAAMAVAEDRTEASLTNLYQEQRELIKTTQVIQDLLQMKVVSPDSEAATHSEVAEQLSIAERQKNTHYRPEETTVTVNLFPGQGERILE